MNTLLYIMAVIGFLSILFWVVVVGLVIYWNKTAGAEDADEDEGPKEKRPLAG